LRIAHLPPSTSKSQLREILAPNGTILNLNLVTEGSKGFSRSTASATVIFDKSQQAEAAQRSLDGQYMGEGYRVKATWGDRELQCISLAKVDNSDRWTHCTV
jgi:RNA recognition motif-containing protein